MPHDLLRKIPALRLEEEFGRLREEILARLEKVCREGRFILGEEGAEFERSFAAWMGLPHAVTCASGSDALLLSLMALEIRSGDEVLTSALGFFSTASAMVRLGAKPVFVDIDPASFTMHPDEIEAKVTERTKAILPVHLYGHPCPMDRLLQISKRFHLALVEDCAQAHGSLFRGGKVGSFGDLGCFSLYPTKNLGCYGDGGVVVTRNEELAVRIRSLRVHGEKKKYHHERVGINSRLDEIQAAVLNVKLPLLDEALKKRREKAAFYTALLRESKVPVKPPDEAREIVHTYHQYTVRTARRDALLEFLQGSGIEAGVYYPVPLHLEEAFRFLGYRRGDFPEAERATQEVLSLPLHPELTEEDQLYVVQKIQEFYR